MAADSSGLLLSQTAGIITYNVYYRTTRVGKTIGVRISIDTILKSGSTFGYYLDAGLWINGQYYSKRIKENSPSSWSMYNIMLPNGTDFYYFGEIGYQSTLPIRLIFTTNNTGASGKYDSYDITVPIPLPDPPSNITVWSPVKTSIKPNETTRINFWGAAGNDNTITDYHLYFKNERTGTVIGKAMGNTNGYYDFRPDSIFTDVKARRCHRLHCLHNRKYE